jgi:hypothetical protein
MKGLKVNCDSVPETRCVRQQLNFIQFLRSANEAICATITREHKSIIRELRREREEAVIESFKELGSVGYRSFSRAILLRLLTSSETSKGLGGPR